MKAHRARRAALLAVLIALAAPHVLADDEEAARTAFRRGVELFQEGDYSSALDQFQTADEAHHSPAIRYNIARCRESLGQAQAAVESYEAYLAEAGEQGEFASAAAVAVAQLKARSVRVRVTTEPAGARVFIDGVEVRERSPVSVLLKPGRHRIDVDNGEWKDGREYEAKADAPGEVAFARSTPTVSKPALVRAKPTRKKKSEPKPSPAPTGPVLDGFMGGAAFSVYGYRFVGSAKEQQGDTTTTADNQPTGIAFGLAIELGYGLSSRTALLLRGFGALGSSQGELASLAAGGPALSFRLSHSFWAGAGIIFGGSRADSDATSRQPLAAAQDSQITYRTDFALGPMLELSYALGDNPAGQWLVSIVPSTLLTTHSRQSTLFIPVMIGHRWL